MCLEVEAAISTVTAAHPTLAQMSSSGGVALAQQQQQQCGRQTPPKVEPEQQQQAEDQQQHQQQASSSASTGSPAVSRSPSPMEYPTDASVLKERYSQHMQDPDSSQDMDSDSLGGQTNADTDKSSKYMSGLEEMEMFERNPFMAAAGLRHRYSMLGAAMSQDTSKLLRGILQSKDKRLSGALGTSLDPDEQEMFAKMQERAALLRHTSFDTDLDSMPSGTPGDISEDSDQENQVGESNYNENSMSDDEKDKNIDSENGDVTEVKRARVDSIINNLHMSPYKPLSELSQGELRRPKRKQYIPQQHDSRNMEEPSPKVRKVEEEAFKCQLKFMQQQLSDMQQKYFELLDHNGQVNGAEIKKPSFTINGIMGSREDIVKPSPIASLAEVAHSLEPSHFFKTANKMVKDQELGGGKGPELDHLAKILKQEISSNINTLVDSIVGKFIEKQKTVKKVAEKPLVNNNNNNITTATQNNMQGDAVKEKTPSRSPTPEEIMSSMSRDQKESGTPKPPRTKVTDKILPPMLDIRPRLFQDFPRHPLFPPPPYFGHLAHSMPIFPVKEPEQTEPMSLVISTPKKKRTKVTDTRLSPRAARALLQDGSTHSPELQESKSPHPHPLLGPYGHHHHPALGGDFPGSLVPVTLPTSVAIPNPSLQHSEVLAMYSHADHHHHHHHHHNGFSGSEGRPLSQSPLIGDNGSPNTAHTPSDNMHSLAFKTDSSDFHHSFPHHSHLGSLDDSGYDGMQVTSTLTPMHLRKAKLMFFYVRYPSSAIIKMYFPDVKFNKNNTAQLVKWFSNFREFYYIQMEKYARQALAEGVKNPEDLAVSTDAELYRVLNLHYNRNNQIEVPDSFRGVVEQTLREFFKAVQAGKDSEQSWKKAIYKVIARLDDQIPEYFKSPNWMETLNDM